jgi:beta-galactosidase
MNAYRAVKQPGVADTFRIPKLGAAFYQAQVSPEIRAVIIPNFYWDFGPECPNGPGKNAAIFSNCDRLEVFIDRRRYAVVTADRAGFPHLRYPPFFCDLAADGAAHPELRIDAYVGNKLALSRSFSSDRRQDRFLIKADDDALAADGSDATRLVFMTTDVYGTLRPFNAGEVSFQLTGPGIIVGDNPFNLADGGGAGAVWIRTLRNSTGLVRVTATHSRLGVKSVTIAVRHAAP